MNRNLFRERLLEGAAAARDFARQYIREKLPDDIRFHLHLNQSYDGGASPEFELFPGDSAIELQAPLKHLAVDDVVQVLWRNGLVPQWVNLNVVSETGTETVLDVVACGRFTADEASLYHIQEGLAPFHILGPTLPVAYKDGDKFSIYTCSTCWCERDLDRARSYSNDVWSLELNGPEIVDRVLSRGLDFPRAEILEIRGTFLTGEALAMLVGMPNLRVLRFTCGPLASLDLLRLPVVPQLEDLSLTNLPSSIKGVARLSECLPRLSNLSLGSSIDVAADHDLVVQPLERLTLEFPDAPAWVKVASARSIGLHFDRCTDEVISALVRGTLKAVTSVGLRRTPVTDTIFETLSILPNLTYVDLVNTNVTDDALLRFTAQRPNLKHYPCRMQK